MTSKHFLTWAAAYAKTSALQLVAAPCMKRGLLNRFAVPHSSLIPVRCCSSFSTLTIVVKVLVRLRQSLAFRRHVAIVEGVERSAQLLDELEGCMDAVLRVFDGVGAVFPRPVHRPGPERIAACAAERVPVDHAEAEMLLHRLAFHEFVLVVPTEGQGVLGLRTFVTDLADFGECGHELLFPLTRPAAATKLAASLRARMALHFAGIFQTTEMIANSLACGNGPSGRRTEFARPMRYAARQPVSAFVRSSVTLEILIIGTTGKRRIARRCVSQTGGTRR